MFTTNEAGEIILVEPTNTPAKKTRAAKKKEKEPTFLPPFFSEEYFKFIIGPDGAGQGELGTSPHLLLKWKNEEYLPLYSMNIKLPNNLPIYEYRSLIQYLGSNPNVWGSIRIGKLLKEHTPEHGFKYFKRLWETKNYRLLSFFTESYISPAVEIDFKVRMKELVDRVFNRMLQERPVLDILIPQGGYKAGTPSLMGKFKYYNEWRWTQIKQVGINYNNLPIYLSNLGFIARQSVWNSHGGGINQPGLYPIKPLVCMVIKKEHFDLVKAYILANEPIPTELIELWVDKSLEDPEDTSQPIKTSYIRQIRNPYKKLGVEIVIKDDLTAELFNKPELKKFRTHNEQLEWIDNILKEFTQIEKTKLRIS